MLLLKLRWNQEEYNNEKIPYIYHNRLISYKHEHYSRCCCSGPPGNRKLSCIHRDYCNGVSAVCANSSHNAVAVASGWSIKSSSSGHNGNAAQTKLFINRTAPRKNPRSGFTVSRSRIYSFIVISVPFPTSLFRLISPSCSSTMCFTMASPSPVPPVSRDRLLSTR